eukprot:Trichotokara_eunicae@DN6356_c2_g1_i11.p1
MKNLDSFKIAILNLWLLSKWTCTKLREKRGLLGPYEMSEMIKTGTSIVKELEKEYYHFKELFSSLFAYLNERVSLMIGDDKKFMTFGFERKLGRQSGLDKKSVCDVIDEYKTVMVSIAAY